MPMPDWADEGLSQQLAILRAKGESQELEYIEGFPQNTRELAKEIAAFATSNAGMILLGVSNNGDLVGLADAQSLEGRDSLIRRIEGICRGTLKPAITPTIKFAIENSLVILVIVVPKGTQPIYYLHNIPYIRHLTESRPAEPHEVIDCVRVWLENQLYQTVGDDPKGVFVSELASVLADVITHGEEAHSRMVNPWLALWRAQFEQAANVLRELAIQPPASDFQAVDELKQLAGELDSVSHFRMYMGCLPEFQNLLNSALETAKKLKGRLVDSVPLSKDSLDEVCRSVAAAARRLRGLCERASYMINHGRIRDLQSEASQIGESLLKVSQFNIDVLDPGLASRLRDVGQKLHLVETQTLVMDGGKTLREIIQAIEDGCQTLESISSQLPV